MTLSTRHVALFALLGLSLAAGCRRRAPDAASAPDLAGSWTDAVGDAPWRWIELTARDPQHGHFVGRANCQQPPCPAAAEGDYDLDGDALRIHARGLEGETFTVRIGGRVMEWRQNDVQIRRFERQAPTVPSRPLPEYPPRSARPAPGVTCDAMTAAQCLQATRCVLEPAPGGPYVCRPAAGACEGGAAQSAPDFAMNCAAHPGCAVREGSCFCPNARTRVAPAPGSEEAFFASVMCACGGGPYRQCVAPAAP